MPAANLWTVRRLFEAVEARDVEPLYEIYSERVTIHEAPSLPYGGDFTGHDGVLRHGLGYLRTWEPLQREEDRRLDPSFVAGENRVLVRWRQRAHGAGGATLDVPVVSDYRLEQRQVVESRMHPFDTVAIVAFLAGQGASPAPARV